MLADAASAARRSENFFSYTSFSEEKSEHSPEKIISTGVVMERAVSSESGIHLTQIRTELVER